MDSVLVYICGKWVLSLISIIKAYLMFTLRNLKSHSQIFFISNSIFYKIKSEVLRIKGSN